MRALTVGLGFLDRMYVLPVLFLRARNGMFEEQIRISGPAGVNVHRVARTDTRKKDWLNLHVVTENDLTG